MEIKLMTETIKLTGDIRLEKKENARIWGRKPFVADQFYRAVARTCKPWVFRIARSLYMEQSWTSNDAVHATEFPVGGLLVARLGRHATEADRPTGCKRDYRQIHTILPPGIADRRTGCKRDYSQIHPILTRREGGWKAEATSLPPIADN
jgi:hypothetical protein